MLIPDIFLIRSIVFYPPAGKQTSFKPAARRVGTSSSYQTGAAWFCPFSMFQRREMAVRDEAADIVRKFSEALDRDDFNREIEPHTGEPILYVQVPYKAKDSSAV